MVVLPVVLFPGGSPTPVHRDVPLHIARGGRREQLWGSAGLLSAGFLQPFALPLPSFLSLFAVAACSQQGLSSLALLFALAAGRCLPGAELLSRAAVRVVALPAGSRVCEQSGRLID